MPNFLYPYPTLERDVTLSMLSADVDGVSLDDCVDITTRTVSLYSFGKPRWGELTLRVTVAISDKDAERFLANGKIMNVILRAQCRSTSARQAILLAPTGTATWAGTLVLPYEAYSNQISIEALVTVDDPDRHVIGTADPWRIRIVPGEKAPPPQFSSIIDCDYVSFSSAPEPYLKNSKNKIAYIDLNRPKPMLWLNDDIPGLRSVLGDAMTRKGPSSDFRDALAASLSGRMWHALIDYSIHSIEPPNDGDSPDIPTGWPGHVINKVITHLFPGYERRQAIGELYDASRSDAQADGTFIALVDNMVDEFARVSALIKPRLANSTIVEEVLHDAP